MYILALPPFAPTPFPHPSFASQLIVLSQFFSPPVTPPSVVPQIIDPASFVPPPFGFFIICFSIIGPSIVHSSTMCPSTIGLSIICPPPCAPSSSRIAYSPNVPCSAHPCLLRPIMFIIKQPENSQETQANVFEPGSKFSYNSFVLDIK
jgi:hypothetical protein